MSSCKVILRWLMSGTLYSLCIVRKLPRLPVIKGFGLNRCNAKSEIWGYVSQLNTVCLEARDFFMVIHLHGKYFILEIGVREYAEKINEDTKNDLKNQLGSQGFIFPVPL